MIAYDVMCKISKQYTRYKYNTNITMVDDYTYIHELNTDVYDCIM